MFNLWLDMFLITYCSSITEFAKVRKTMSDFFRTGISSQSKTDPAVSESLCKVAGSSSEIGQGGMDASSEISEEDIPLGKYQQSS